MEEAASIENTKTDNIDGPSPSFSTSALDIEDLNNMISIIKRREENLIQLLDFTSKPKKIMRASISKAMANLQEQLLNMENERKGNEDTILKKYVGFRTVETKTKK